MPSGQPDPDQARDIEVGDQILKAATTPAPILPVGDFSKVKCACVHHDPYECARLRDRRVRDAGDVDECLDPERRECECCCHDDYAYDDWDDD